MENLNKCPACDSLSVNDFLDIPDFSISQEVFQTKLCSECSLVFTSPRPTQEEIGRYYQGDAYISHSNTKNGLINKVYHLVREIALKNKLDIIIQLHPKSKRLLDVGCGAGSFLQYAAKKEWDVTGIEPQNELRDSLNNKGIEVFNEDFFISSERRFSIITLWHVLEHVHALKERIRQLFSALEDHGHVLIAVPNHASFDRQHYKKFWAAYDVPRHLYHFSDESIIPMFEKEGFSFVKKLPMPFDSFYVSMLSEKYMKGKTNYFTALKIGALSNFRGKKTGNFSSNIYVFQKK